MRRRNPPVPPWLVFAGGALAGAATLFIGSVVFGVTKKFEESADARYTRAVALLATNAEHALELVPAGGTGTHTLWFAQDQPEARLVVWRAIDRGSFEGLQARAKVAFDGVTPPLRWCIRTATDDPPTGYGTCLDGRP
jgi:hypothetical protein